LLRTKQLIKLREPLLKRFWPTLRRILPSIILLCAS
jgi:hypothetical protein